MGQPALLLSFAAIALSLGPVARAERATVAVATNFAVPMQALEQLFEQASGHDLATVQGSTGQLYAQIVNGAPFDVFLAADQLRPRLLAESGLGLPGTLFTYAVGQLVLWSNDTQALERSGLDLLGSEEYRRLAIANPALAPYGAAAQQTLEALGLWEKLQPRLVRGQDIGQTFSIVVTRNAELGLVARAQVIDYPPAHYVPVPGRLHEPIRQDAALLARAESNPAALAFIAFLRSPEAVSTLREFGYEIAADR